MRQRLVAIALGAGLTLAVGCRGEPAPRRAQLRIAAASDLNAALGDLTARFSASHPVDVSVSYGSSGTFYAQLLNQAPYDLFFSADMDYPRQLAARGATLPGGEFEYGVGRLVVWVPSGSSIDPKRDGLRALTSPAVQHVSMANPDHAPYGRAAVAALRAAGMYDAVRSKLVLGESVAQALQFVESGAADAGIVAMSLALGPAVRDKGKFGEIPAADYPRLDQEGTILRWAADVEAARAFRSFVVSGEGRAILRQYGFSMPGE